MEFLLGTREDFIVSQRKTEVPNLTHDKPESQSSPVGHSVQKGRG